LSQLHLWQRTYWSRVGLSILLTLVPPLVPYLVSAIHSRSLVTPKRLRLGLFIAFLIITTVLMTSMLLGQFGYVGWGMLLAVFIAQTFAYVWGANILLRGSANAL
jgi:hypothetical protein